MRLRQQHGRPSRAANIRRANASGHAADTTPTAAARTESMESVPPSASAGARADEWPVAIIVVGATDDLTKPLVRVRIGVHTSEEVAAAAVIQQTHRAKRAAADAQARVQEAADAAETAAAYALIAEHATFFEQMRARHLSEQATTIQARARGHLTRVRAAQR